MSKSPLIKATYKGRTYLGSSQEDIKAQILDDITKPSEIKFDFKLQYEVRSGDTLYSIAKRFLGDGDLWPKVADLNRSVIHNPNIISPGMVIDLPAGMTTRVP